MSETETTREVCKLRFTRSKQIRWRADGLVERAQWIIHRTGYSIEFHVSDHPLALSPDFPHRDIEVEGVGTMRISECPGGIEIHRRSPSDYEPKDKPADHEHCSVLGAPCWHDGTSLGASEFAETWHGDDASVWALLERWAGYEEKEDD